MSQTAAALRAAKEVQADVLAPELYRLAQENFTKAKREYKFKNFSFATVYLKKARRLAENSEFEALRNGGNRTSEQVPDPLANGPAGADASQEQAQSPTSGPLKSLAPAPYTYPTPTGTPIEVYDQRKAEEDAARKNLETAGGERSGSGGAAPSSPPPTSTPSLTPPTPPH
jgi:hypothetical protein